MKRTGRGLGIAGGIYVGLTLMSVGMCFAPPGRLACGNVTGFAPAMLELIEACAPATERLGTPVSFSSVGGGFGGNYQSGRRAGGEGYAHGDLVVEGPKGSARVDYQMQKSLGVWGPVMLRLSFDDGSLLDVKACTAELMTRKSEASFLAMVERLCAEGQAQQCLALAELREASGDAEGASKARAQACALGLASACGAR